MRFFVTGIGGFVGAHLAATLLEAGHEVRGITRGDPVRPRLAALHRRFPEAFPASAVVRCDVLGRESLLTQLHTVAPDGVFNLAGETYVPRTLRDPVAAYRVNFLGAVSLLAAVSEVSSRCRVVQVGSAEAYGLGAAAGAVAETTPFQPVSPYGVSKAAADLAAYEWFHSRGVDVVRARPFNHTGPGQAAAFVCSGLARQIAEVALGRRAPVVEVGNLEVVRDFSDARDIARGYLALWERGRSGEAYNLCSGTGRSIESVVDLLARLAGTSVSTKPCRERLRAGEMTTVVGSCEKARAETGWSPVISFEQTLADLLDDWRAVLVG